MCTRTSWEPILGTGVEDSKCSESKPLRPLITHWAVEVGNCVDSDILSRQEL